jgi:hypothetical protein
MTQQPHDQFAKQFLTALLEPLGGQVKTNYEIHTQRRYVDLYFLPNAVTDESWFQKLGLLGRMVRHACLLEPFRNSPTSGEVRNCLSKLFAVHSELQNDQTRQNQKPLTENELPNLWLLATTVYQPLLKRFEARTYLSEWGEGIYFLAEGFKAAIIDIQALPLTPETLFLRMLGKGITQKQAIKEILMFPFDNLLRQQVLELLVDYHFSLKTKETKTPDDEEWLMHLSAAYLKWREETLQQGIQQGINQGIDQGIRQERRRFIENLLKSRFEKLDDELKSVIELLLQLPTEESSRLLLQASREELLVRFKH